MTTHTLAAFTLGTLTGAIAATSIALGAQTTPNPYIPKTEADLLESVNVDPKRRQVTFMPRTGDNWRVWIWSANERHLWKFTLHQVRHETRCGQPSPIQLSR